MELTPTPSNTASTKSPEPEPDTPTRIQKPLPFTNGVLKRHLHHHPPPPPSAASAVAYRECLKNHAASIGGHALDGCGEFMPSPAATDSDPTSIKCAACGCHRNFHRRDPDDLPHSSPLPAPATQVIEYQPHHRHHPPPPLPPPPPPRSPDSASPPPISSSYYAHHSRPHHNNHLTAASHMLFALSTGGPPESSHPPPSSGGAAMVSPLSRKRFRTKFSQTQKEQMFEFAERVGWKIQKRDDDMIRQFCHDIGVERGVLKVWMHNNKNTLGRRTNADLNNTQPLNINSAAISGATTPTDILDNNNNNNISRAEHFDIPTTSNQMSKSEANGHHHHHDHLNHHNHPLAGANGSRSSPE